MIIIAIITLGIIGAAGAALLYVTSKKFEVVEDPRIAQVQSVLPGANCGGCGYPGCSGFASACVKATSLDGMLCPVGGAPVMAKVASILGLEAEAAEPKIELRHSFDLVWRRDWLLFRMLGLWRLREGLLVRCYPH